MCAPDPNAGARFAAEQRQIAKHAKFGSESIKYWNRETTYKRGKEAIAMGYSRGRSDAYVKALDIAATGRAQKEATIKVGLLRDLLMKVVDQAEQVEIIYLNY